MSTYHVSLGFTKLSDADLVEFTGGIIDNLTGNILYPTPPVTMTALGTARTNFQNDIAAMAQGGTAATAAKNASRETLLGLLRQLANYVQGIASDNLPDLLSSGFDANSTNRTASPLATPSITKILNEMTTQLILRVTSLANAKSYETRYQVGAGPWQSGGVSTQARRIVVAGLTPGTTYTFSVRGVGGSTDFSDWSDPVSHMCL